MITHIYKWYVNMYYLEFIIYYFKINIILTGGNLIEDRISYFFNVVSLQIRCSNIFFNWTKIYF